MTLEIRQSLENGVFTADIPNRGKGQLIATVTLPKGVDLSIIQRALAVTPKQVMGFVALLEAQTLLAQFDPAKSAVGDFAKRLQPLLRHMPIEAAGSCHKRLAELAKLPKGR